MPRGLKPKRNASGYLYVYPHVIYSGKKCHLDRKADLPWMGKITIGGTNIHKEFATEREAALWVDRQLIRLGRPPVNILVPKQQPFFP